MATCWGIIFSRLHFHLFHRSFIWNFLAPQRRNMNIWLKVRNWQQVPTFRKFQLKGCFPLLPFHRYLTWKKMFMNVELVLFYALFSCQCHYMTLKQVSVACSFSSFIIADWPLRSNFSSPELKHEPMSQN